MNRVRTRAIIAAIGIAGLGACATLEEGVGQLVADTYTANLTGAQEVGGGDPDGSGKAEITVSDELNQICWNLSDIRNIGEIAAAHIHVGAAGTNGPPVFTLTKSNEGAWRGCKNDSEWKEDRIEGNPEAFYVNVHTAEYPAGAIRGQLSKK